MEIQIREQQRQPDRFLRGGGVAALTLSFGAGHVPSNLEHR